MTPCDLAEVEIFGGNSLPAIDTSLSNREFVDLCIKRAQKFFYKESGNNEAKKQSLSDNKYTKIDTSVIIKEYPHQAQAARDAVVSGNIKALVPLTRELLTPESIPENVQQLRYRHG